MICVLNLFTNILKTSLSGSVLILLILLVRLAFSQSSKGLVCLFWMMAILRLLIPFRIETSWSLQPSAAALTNHIDSVQVCIADLSLMQEDFQTTIQHAPENAVQTVGVYQILGLVWLFGFAVMFCYALASYLRLRKRVGQSVKLSNGVYWCPGLDTAFLFGYFRPRIYLPEHDQYAARYMWLHEQAHLRRGDHWLMLAGYIALCLHWFNPLVWLCYICLCGDIERACDALVIRHLDAEERKAYANVLLSCGKHRSFPVSCPVAFGEVSVKHRILAVLNYSKPTMRICCLLLAILVFVGVFFLTDPVEYPPYYMVLMNALSDPLDEVCQQLGLEKEDLLSDGTGNYAAPVYVNYADVTMQLYLHTTVDVEGEPLRFFSYVALFDAGVDEADKAVAAIARKLYKTYGPGEIGKLGSKPNLFRDISPEEVTALFDAKANTVSIFDYWDITNSGDGNLDIHLENLHIERKEKYDDMHGAVCYMARFAADYDYEKNIKAISISFRNYLSFTDEFGTPYAIKLSPPR